MKKIVLLLVVFLVGCSHSVTDPVLPDREKAAKINLNLALYYLSEHDPDRAKSRLNVALIEDRNDVEVLMGAAYFYQCTQNWKMAELYYQLAFREDKTNPALLNNYGVMLCEEHRYREALVFFNKAAQSKYNLTPEKASQNAVLCKRRLDRLA